MIRKIIPLLLFVILLLTSCAEVEYDFTTGLLDADSTTAPMMHLLNPDAEVRGVWIASVYNIDYPSAADLSPEELRAELDAILDTCERCGLNTLFFQVRPTGDALYESDLFPVSRYLSTDGTLPFDPLGYLVTAAHQRNVRVHAWVNPLRLSMNTTDPAELPDGSPAKAHPEWTVPYADGRLYLNAGLPEVCALVADGVAEIVRGYDVDGVVFDDYFYPYPVAGDDGVAAAFNDDAAYEQYGGGMDRGDWRRQNINTMVEACYKAVHETDPDCVFGIAPGGIWQNNDGKNGGSDTLYGFETYNSLYCDALAWIRGGTIDYISPQIYWRFDDKYTPYDVVLRWWNTQLDGTNVKLYVSHAAYRYEDGDWSAPEGEIAEQVSFGRSEWAYAGSVFYGYDEVSHNCHGIGDELARSYTDEILYTGIISNDLGVTVSSPANGATMTSDHTWVLGSSDPYYPLTLNGQKVCRTKSGYFNLYLTLDEGENVFTFTQNGHDTTYTLYYRPDGIPTEPTEPKPVILPSVSAESLYPASEIATSGKTLWVSCTAPCGSTVSVTLGGSETPLEALDTPAEKVSEDGYVGVSYGAEIPLPEAEKGEILDLGTLRYTVSHPAGTVNREGVRVRVLGEDAMIPVRTTRDYAALKITPTSSYYNDYTVQSAGMTDYAISLADGFYHLQMGGYLPVTDAVEIDETPKKRSVVSAVSVSDAGDVTEIRFACDGKPAYNGCIDETGRFVVTLYSIDTEAELPAPTVSENPLIVGGEPVVLDGKVRYAFDLVAIENFYGFDLAYEDGAVVVSLRNPKAPTHEDGLPLSGFTIALDAGHGGSETGALGLDPQKAEKDLNRAVTLAAAERLESLGANVILLNPDDDTFALTDRTAWFEENLRENAVDFCISLHQNSMDYSVDITRIRGTLALWCMDGGQMLSDCVGSAIAKSLGFLYRGADFQLLAMCRNPKFPAALVETSFITSAEEYEEMTSARGIRLAAEGVADGVLAYVEKMEKYASVS